jgi:Na+/melibiose symporter-like transporter
MPEPGLAGYRSLQLLAWTAAPFVMVFGTVVLVGVRRTPDDRDGYIISWPVCCAIAAAATVVCYSTLFALRRHRSRAAAVEARRERQTRSQNSAEAYWEETRSRYFGDKRLPLAIPVSPALWTVPVMFSGVEQLPPDPVTGQAPVNVGSLVVGIVLPVLAIILWSLTGRGLTALCVLAWTGWAGAAVGGHETGAAIAGWIGLVAVVVATVATTVVRRRELARGA